MKKGNAGTVQQRDAGKNRKVSILSSSAAYLGKIILVAVVYYLSGRVGLLFSIFNGNIAMINPPSGIALAGLLIFGWEYLPGVVLGAFATTISTGVPLSYALITVVGNSLAALVPALLIGRGKKFTCLNLDRTDTVATLIIFGMLLGWTLVARRPADRWRRGAIFVAVFLLCFAGGTVWRPYVNWYAWQMR